VRRAARASPWPRQNGVGLSGKIRVARTDGGKSSGGRNPGVAQLHTMPTTPDELFAYLDSLGIVHRTVRHPPLFTVEESQALRGKIPGGHTKNLFLKDKKDALYLVVALEDAVIELKSLHRRLSAGGRFSFGSADLMRATLGVEPGAVTPFAAINDTAGRVTVVLDAAMMAHTTLNYHPLRNTMTTAIGRDDLVRFLEATRHPPRVEALAEPVGATP
jgi:Ala-tRNA(Pro) deacylase